MDLFHRVFIPSERASRKEFLAYFLIFAFLPRVILANISGGERYLGIAGFLQIPFMLIVTVRRIRDYGGTYKIFLWLFIPVFCVPLTPLVVPPVSLLVWEFIIASGALVMFFTLLLKPPVGEKEPT